jgi:hypothetical protein
MEVLADNDGGSLRASGSEVSSPCRAMNVFRIDL